MQCCSPDKKNGTVTCEAIASALFFLALWGFWGLRYGDYLYAAQENSIFHYHWDFLARWLDCPDGLLNYATAFLVQFFYYPLLGGAILAALGVAVQLATAMFIRWKKGPAYLLSFLPTCFMTISATWPAYFVFIPFNVPLVFSANVAILATFAVLAIYRNLKSFPVRLTFAFAVVAFGYFGFGCWATFACLFCAIDELLRDDDKKISWKKRGWRVCVILAFAICVPLLLWRFWFLSRLKIYNVFTCGLIEDVRYDKDSLTATFVYGFAALTPVYCAVLYAWSRFLDRRYASESERCKRDKKRAERLQRKLEKIRDCKNNVKKERETMSEDADAPTTEDAERVLERKRLQLMFELFFLLVVATFLTAYHTRAFFACVESNRALADGDWNRILEIDSKQQFPLDQLVAVRNLALYKTGRFAEDAFLRPIAGETTLSVSVADNAKALAGNPYYQAKMKLFYMKRTTEKSAYRSMLELILCHWGLTNIGARISMDNYVATEDRSISFCKTLAIAAIVNGEKKLASRYLREVGETLFYKKWANVRLAYLASDRFYQGVRDFNNDSAYQQEEQNRREQEPPGASLENAASLFGVELDELKRVATLVAQARELRPDRNVESKRSYPNVALMIEVLPLNDFDSFSIQKKELALMAALFQKKGDYFLKHIDDYLKLKGCEKGGAPKAIEQGYATWRYSKFQEKWKECDYKFTQETIDGIDAFSVLAKTLDLNSIAGKATMRDYCSGTYWGYAVDDSTFKQY